jgi:hypothetical protein
LVLGAVAFWLVKGASATTPTVAPAPAITPAPEKRTPRSEPTAVADHAPAPEAPAAVAAEPAPKSRTARQVQHARRAPAQPPPESDPYAE